MRKIKFLWGFLLWGVAFLSTSLGTVFAISLTDSLPDQFIWPFTAGIVTPFVSYGLYYLIFMSIPGFKAMIHR